MAPHASTDNLLPELERLLARYLSRGPPPPRSRAMIKMQLPNITRKKLKIVFAVHLFSAMFAMLAWPNNNVSI